jgi:phosphatidylglycerophosphate synthase
MNASIDNVEEAMANIERRPLRSRRWRLTIVLAARLARRGLSPNAISVFGLGAGILGALSLWWTFKSSAPWVFWLLAAGLVQLRLLCNLIDGMVAVESGRASRLGELYNEIPDRISDAATLVGLGFAAGSDQWLGFVAAVLAVFVAYVRAAVKIAGAPQDYSGPMAKPHRMFVVTVTALFCTVVPMHVQTAWLGRDWGLPAIALGVIIVGCVVTALRRLMRAAMVLKASTP